VLWEEKAKGFFKGGNYTSSKIKEEEVGLRTTFRHLKIENDIGKAI
jgi:hypothetical protein